jgi:hypothetical protein
LGCGVCEVDVIAITIIIILLRLSHYISPEGESEEYW